MPAPAHLGIDFGTSHTVAVLRREDGGAAPLLIDGSPVLPSAVYADPGGELYTGRDALHSARLEPARFEPNPKRRVDDGSLLLGGTELSVHKAFAAVLSRVRTECVRVLGSLPPTTLTYPATWGSARRLVLEDAAREAGFHRPRLLHEPVAAAAYFARMGPQDVPEGGAVVVCDFGGGTFDVSVVVRTASGFEVREVDGSAELGGVDLDHLLVDHLGTLFDGSPEWGVLVDPRSPEERRHHRGFVEDVRAAKERLSRYSRAELPVPLLNRDVHLSRDELESLARPLLDRAVRITLAVCRAAGLTPQATAGVFLVGGASRMPLVATLLHQAMGIAPTVIAEPELVVAHGATLPAEADVPVPAAAPPLVAAPPPPPPAVTPEPGPVADPAPEPAATPTAVLSPPASEPAPPAPRRPVWLTLARVAMWIQAVVLAGFAAGMIGATVEYSGTPYESDVIQLCSTGDYDPCVNRNYIDLDGDDETDVRGYLTEDLVDLDGVFPALAWPVALVAGAAAAWAAIRSGRRGPSRRLNALSAEYAVIACPALILAATGVADTFDRSDTVLFLLVPAGAAVIAAVALLLLHRRRARDWFAAPG